MKALLKNWLLPIRRSVSFFKKQNALLCILFFSFYISTAQIANYISNGGFEDYYSCNGPSYSLKMSKSWLSIDSTSFDGLYFSYCNNLIPLSGSTYQFPKKGNSFILSTFYDQNPNGGRGYFKNRLKENLQAGKIYCVKFFVNIANASPRGMDGFGIYFGGNLIDTITKCTIPLSYINPQIKNPSGNVISDTMNWVPITGTFVASGNEKYALIGNFLSDAAVNTASINTPSYPQYWTDICIDNVSCIATDLPVYAGADVYGIPTNTVYFGRPRDVGIDEDCTWYHLPNTTTAIDTAAGVTVTVATITNTYMVKQDICGIIKYDTVVVYASAVGISNEELIKNNLIIFPNPANDILNISINSDVEIKLNKLEILNSLGQIIREEELIFKDKVATIKTNELSNGVYLLNFAVNNFRTINKRIVIAR